MNIIFDFGNVLFDLDLSRIESGLRRLYGAQFDAASAQLQQHNVFNLYETGGLSTEEFVDSLRMAVSPAVPAADVIEVWNSIFLQMPRHRFDLLLQLRQRHKVFMLSNINALHADWIDAYMLREHGITDFQGTYFDAVYYSHLIRLRKPTRESYEYVLADAEIKAEDSVFIDDLQPNILAAEAVGIRGIWHTGDKTIEERLMEFL
jgi:glucose-1-phosphatase